MKNFIDQPFNILAVTVFVIFHITCVTSLECYACLAQEGNRDKCVKTTKQCEENQDRCISVMGWGAPPKWMPYGHRVHYIWKECETSANCDQRRTQTRLKCKRDWYRDWTCTECCTGDLCNYYVTLDAERSHMVNIITISVSIVTAFVAVHIT